MLPRHEGPEHILRQVDQARRKGESVPLQLDDEKRFQEVAERKEGPGEGC